MFLVTFTTHSFAKSNEYYQATLAHMLTECNTECKKKIFEDEETKCLKTRRDTTRNKTARNQTNRIQSKRNEGSQLNRQPNE